MKKGIICDSLTCSIDCKVDIDSALACLQSKIVTISESSDTRIIYCIDHT